MKKFECKSCTPHCELIPKKTGLFPEFCPFAEGHKTVWCEVKEDHKLPKLTEEVFDRPECFAWADYAAVGADGKGFYFQSEPAKTDHAWRLPDDCKIANIGIFDASDWENSLIKRPPKEDLPDWVKVDNLGWHQDTGYFKIIDVDDIEKRVHIQQMDGQTEKYCSFNTACTEAKYARTRPFNEKEMKALVGKVIKNGPGMHLVIGCDNVLENEWVIYVKDCMFSGNDLMRHEYTLDGKPCYFLEHLNDKGEWVK